MVGIVDTPGILVALIEQLAPMVTGKSRRQREHILSFHTSIMRSLLVKYHSSRLRASKYRAQVTGQQEVQRLEAKDSMR